MSSSEEKRWIHLTTPRDASRQAVFLQFADVVDGKTGDSSYKGLKNIVEKYFPEREEGLNGLSKENCLQKLDEIRKMGWLEPDSQQRKDLKHLLPGFSHTHTTEKHAADMAAPPYLPDHTRRHLRSSMPSSSAGNICSEFDNEPQYYKNREMGEAVDSELNSYHEREHSRKRRRRDSTSSIRYSDEVAGTLTGTSIDHQGRYFPGKRYHSAVSTTAASGRSRFNPSQGRKLTPAKARLARAMGPYYSPTGNPRALRTSAQRRLFDDLQRTLEASMFNWTDCYYPDILKDVEWAEPLHAELHHFSGYLASKNIRAHMLPGLHRNETAGDLIRCLADVQHVRHIAAHHARDVPIRAIHSIIADAQNLLRMMGDDRGKLDVDEVDRVFKKEAYP